MYGEKSIKLLGSTKIIWIEQSSGSAHYAILKKILTTCEKSKAVTRIIRDTRNDV